ncbi:MAG: RagB/SusD family nutrient uptake outer membrane protein [Mediterranea sp.]|jgi:hypothetical protein|nr:RagB/SusD family nutrient uptake outer membrane protein [Mediterranea sp.]
MKRLKNNILYAAIALAIASPALTSCEDLFGGFLDKQPSNELTEEQTFSDWNTATQFHNDTYNFLRHGAARVGNTWLDSATDLGENSFSGGTKLSFNIGNYYSGDGWAELTATWEHYYRGIRKCNMVLEKLDGVPKNPSDSDADYERKKMNIKAEARFFRAYFYWEMFLRYGPIPIVTEVLDPDGDLLTGYTTRPTVKQYVVDFVMKELAECEAGLRVYDKGSTDVEINTNQGYINKPIASALYSRIALYMASPRYSGESGVTWGQALAASQTFIDTYGSLYSLYTSGDATNSAYTYAILNTAYNGGNTETIFFRNDVTRGWSAISVDTPVGEGGRGGLCPSQNLVDMYDMADGSSPFAQYDATGAPVYGGGASAPAINSASGYSDAAMWANRDPRLASTILYQGQQWGSGVINVISGQRDNPIGNANSTPTGYYVRKYIPQSILDNTHTGTGYRNWIFMRYAEVLLNYAEAMNEVSGPGQEVYDALDQIRHRAGITGNVADRTDLATKEAMRNFIHKERTVELCFEEHRPWDVRRWNVAREALARPIYGIDVTAAGAIVRKVSQQRVFEDRMYLYPIPEAEEWKTNIENNEGW